MKKTEKRKKLYLIDGSAVYYRSYFAFIRNPLFNSRGENTSATYGFCLTLMKILSQEKPDLIAIVFDTKEPTFRHKMYAEYKATREKMPEEMVAQYPRIMELSQAFNIPVIEKEGYEADDVIGTLAKRAAVQGIEAYMVTGDKDFMQLLEPNIKMYVIRPGKENELFDVRALREKLNLSPQQVIDYLALMGDSSDNVPGVPKVGEKTALALLHQFGSLDQIYEHLDEISRPALQRTLRENKDLAYLSRDLVTIDTAVPVDISLDQLKATPADSQRLDKLFEELEFQRLRERIAEFGNSPGREIRTIQDGEHQYRLIQSRGELDELLQRLARKGFFVFDTETTGLRIFDSEIIGLSFALKPGEAFYVPLNSSFPELKTDAVLAALKPIFEEEKLLKGGQNIKFDGLMLWQHGIELRGIHFDTMIADYLINPGSRQHNLDSMSMQYLNYKMVSIQELIGPRGKNQKKMTEIPVEEVAPYACEDADITLRLQEVLNAKMTETRTRQLFEEVEMPLVEVLMEMEKNGVSLDTDHLKKLSEKMAADMAKLTEEIFAVAGEEFNLNSPQQLGVILFDKLKIHHEIGGRRPSRTATGQYSTSESVLEKYRDNDFVNKILEYRKLKKLKSTYIDTLPRLISPRTERVHTSYNQTVAATGRLSSSDPNLQNIPIRDEQGRQIRAAFVPRNSDWLLLAADYSQVELRVLAHLSGDEGLAAAFARGEDIHATTASAIFNVPISEVTPLQRRKAKEVNFGIIYGISPYGLASRLQINVDEAREIIANYFTRFPAVNEYIMNIVAFAQKNKYVTTLLNRRRYIPEIESSNGNIRQNAERIAINTTIQGTAADLIKLAMINIHRKIRLQALKSLMIMQVHDELVFEVFHTELDKMKKLVREEMEGAMALNVPLKIDIGVGHNWLEAH